MFLVSNWSFQNGFLDYVNRNELNKLEGLGASLQDIYRDEKGWGNLESNRPRWRKLIHEQVSPNRQERDSTLNRSPRDTHKPTKQKNPEHNKPIGRLYLLDHNKMPLIGPDKLHNDVLYKTLFLEKNIIGYIAINKHQQLSYKLDQVFAKQQRRSYLWIAFGSILISIFIALPFSQRLIKPILQLLVATQELAKGRYQSRVEIKQNDEIGELSKSFNSMADNIEAQQKTQQQWLADISHELRTPLSVLKGEIEALLDGVREFNSNNIDSLHQEVDYINSLVEDLHELAQSDMKALSFNKEKIFLKSTIHEAGEIFTNEIDNKELTLSIECSDSVIVYADRNRLNQVFINLFQNNIRYTQKAADIIIQVKNKQGIKILWEDSGPGVTAANLEKLFDRLYREDSSRSSFSKGSGLGLSICRSIIENHQGSMHAYQSKLGGLGIEINLPQIN